MRSVYDFSLAELKNLDQQTFEYLISQGNRSLDESIKLSSTLSQRAYTVMAFVFAFFFICYGVCCKFSLFDNQGYFHSNFRCFFSFLISISKAV